MSRWIPVAKMEECPPGTSRECIAAGRIVALFNVDGTFYALDGVCPHQGGPLGKGTLQQTSSQTCIVTCPWHGWQFDVRTGQHQTATSIVHPTIPVKTDGDSVYVEIDAELDAQLDAQPDA